MRRFSKWQWIGAGLSLLWVLGSLYFAFSSSYEHAKNWSELNYRVCIETKHQSISLCEIEKLKSFDLMTTGNWANAFGLAFIPLPFYWLYGFIILMLGRMLVAGSSILIDIKSLSKPKKFFAYFCYFICGFTVFVVTVVLMGIYTDYQVPAGLGYQVTISSNEGNGVAADYVTAEGTWTTPKDIGAKSNSLYNPIQTSKIVCVREKNQCLESRAMISRITQSSYLMADLIEYEIVSWTPNVIVFKYSRICSDDIYTIDLNSKTVNGIEKFSNNSYNPTYCKAPEQYVQPLTYRLEDGFKVHEELRREANPWLLKVVFSLFGN